MIALLFIVVFSFLWGWIFGVGFGYRKGKHSRDWWSEDRRGPDGY